MPHRLRALRHGPVQQPDEDILVGISRRQGDADAGFELLNTHSNFEKGAADGLESGISPARAFGGCPAQEQQQPIGSGMKKQAERVGFPAMA